MYVSHVIHKHTITLLIYFSWVYNLTRVSHSPSPIPEAMEDVKSWDTCLQSSDVTLEPFFITIPGSQSDMWFDSYLLSLYLVKSL